MYTARQAEKIEPWLEYVWGAILARVLKQIALREAVLELRA